MQFFLFILLEARFTKLKLLTSKTYEVHWLFYVSKLWREITRFFYKQHFYEQRQAEIGKLPSKC